MMASASIPERPRLGWGCRAFESEIGLAIRCPSHSVLIEESSREALGRLLTLLDGRTVSELCASPAGPGWFHVLQLLNGLMEGAFLVDQSEWCRPALEPHSAPPPRLSGRHVVVTGDASVADPLSDGLRALGAVVRRRAPDDAAIEGLPVVVCRAAPDLEFFERFNCFARGAGLAWLPVMTLADEVLSGPFLSASRGPCFACVERRWLGRSSSVQQERLLFDHLRRGGFRVDEAVALPRADWIARVALPTVASALAGVLESGVLVRATFATGDLLTHRIERHPSCTVCAERSHEPPIPNGADWIGEPLSLGELRRRLEPLVDERFGLVMLENVPPAWRSAGAEALHAVVSRFAYPVPESVGSKQQNLCHGCAPDENDARTIAIIEALERYAGISPPLVEVVASYDSLATVALDPTTLPLFSAAQYLHPGCAYRPFDPAAQSSWVWGFSFTHQRPRLVPSAAVYYADDSDLLDETSSGVAAHSVRALALINGAFELVERDAFMIHWLNRLSPPRVDIEHTTDPIVGRMLGFVSSKGWRPYVIDLTTDLEIPVYVALGIRDDLCGHALLIGAGSSIDASAALFRAVRELYAATLAQGEDWSPPEQVAPELVERGQQHHGFYSRPESLRCAEFLWSSPRRSPPPARAWSGESATSAQGLERLVEILAHHDLELIGVDLTPPEVLRRGLCVVRALVPGLQPFAFGRRALRLGGQRLYQAPVNMGYLAHPWREHELNPDPHCFP
jgi:ribosomal protein S12 methylthiotransferase accessory factor